MIHSRINDKWIVYTLIILLCLVLTSFWMISNMYARYSSEASGSDGARVALFGHSQSITLNLDNDKLNNLTPGSSFTYSLKVANYESSKTSEVGEKYNIEIITSGNLPLRYSVQNGTSEIGSFEESKKSEARFENENMKFDAGTKREDEYKITVEWPESRNAEQYAGLVDNIMIQINEEQVD